MSLNKGFWILFLLIIAGGPPAWADSGRWENKGTHEKTWERVQVIKMLKLTETLKMDREQAARFFTVSNQYEETKKKSRRELREDIQRLRGMIRESNLSERDLRDTVFRIKNRKRDLDELINKQTDEELNLLRPEQQARYILFTIDFRQEMESLIREIREGKTPRPGYETPSEKTR
jgi:hypothetical protein